MWNLSNSGVARSLLDPDSQRDKSPKIAIYKRIKELQAY